MTERDKTTPFLIRAFVKIGSFHRITLFEDGTLPTTDEHQIYTWKDATLQELVTTLRTTLPSKPEYRHPLARFSIRTIYADAANRGKFAFKDLGIVYSRDILGEPGVIKPDDDEDITGSDKTLEEIRFYPGDYMSIAVLLPKSVTGTATNTENVKGGDGGWGGAVGNGNVASTGGRGGGGGHWRGDSSGRGSGGRGGGGDRRVPPPRRGADSPPRRGADSPPPRRGGRGGRGGGRRHSSRSRSPPPRRRYD